MVVVRSVRISTSMEVGSDARKLRQQVLDAVDHFDDVGAGLALNIDDHRGSIVHPRRQPARFRRRRPRWPRPKASPERRCGRR